MTVSALSCNGPDVIRLFTFEWGLALPREHKLAPKRLRQAAVHLGNATENDITVYIRLTSDPSDSHSLLPIPRAFPL
jgi:hypothetical protein